MLFGGGRVCSWIRGRDKKKLELMSRSVENHSSLHRIKQLMKKTQQQKALMARIMPARCQLRNWDWMRYVIVFLLVVVICYLNKLLCLVLSVTVQPGDIQPNRISFSRCPLFLQKQWLHHRSCPFLCSFIKPHLFDLLQAHWDIRQTNEDNAKKCFVEEEIDPEKHSV